MTSTDLISLVSATGRAALIDADESQAIKGGDLLARIDGLAAQLLAAGLLPGGAVGLILDHGPAAVVAFLATVRCNAIAVPVNPQLHPHEMEALLTTRRPALIVLGEHGAAQGSRVAAQLGVPCLSLTPGRDSRLREVESGRPAHLPEPDPDAIALLLHTSGTTGRPKAVPLRQRNLAASARSIADGYRLDVNDVSYCLMPLFHVHGLVASVLAAFASGGTVVVPRRVRPQAAWSHCTRHAVTWFSAVPTILAKLPTPEAQDRAHLRFARSCSSALAPVLWTTLEDSLGVPVVEAYGMTEAAHQIASNPLPPHERRPGTVGQPMGADVRLLDENWEDCSPGASGEVAVRGPGVVDCYLDNEQATVEAFRDGWFRTGDLGRFSQDGYLVLEGRLKELINRGGEKIAPREIDDALLTHPGVVEAVAFGRGDTKWGEVVEAAVVVSTPVAPSELQDYCRDRLAAFKVPRTIHVVDSIPKSPTGKVQRQRLAEVLSA